MWWTLLLSTPSHMVNVLIIAIIYLYFVLILRKFFLVKLSSVVFFFSKILLNENERLDAFKLDRYHWGKQWVLWKYVTDYAMASILAMHKIQCYLNRKSFETKIHANAKFENRWRIKWKCSECWRSNSYN